MPSLGSSSSASVNMKCSTLVNPSARVFTSNRFTCTRTSPKSRLPVSTPQIDASSSDSTGSSANTSPSSSTSVTPSSFCPLNHASEIESARTLPGSVPFT